MSPSPEFIRVAANKQRTCEALAAAGVPVPAGRFLEPDEPLPSDIAVSGRAEAGEWGRVAGYLPGERAVRYAAGVRVASAAGELCARPGRRAWRCCAGRMGELRLTPCKQRISDDGRLRYLGGELPLAAGLAERASQLGRAGAGCDADGGWVCGRRSGSGPRAGWSEDAVIEINPRLTTSYVGLRAAATSNLAEAMWHVAQGEVAASRVFRSGHRIRCSGNVSFCDELARG